MSITLHHIKMNRFDLWALVFSKTQFNYQDEKVKGNSKNSRGIPEIFNRKPKDL